jgi:hypothetical protein
MSHMNSSISLIVQTTLIIVLVALAGYGVSQAGNPEIRSATFFVG